MHFRRILSELQEGGKFGTSISLEDPFAYRPICMLDTCGKLFEKILVRRLGNHIFSSDFMSNSQYGFRPGHSTIDAMSRVRNIFVRAKGRD